MASPQDDYLIRPDPLDPRLTEHVKGIDQTGAAIETSVTVERALTIFLNSQEIVTAMTINDHPEYLALGYLLNQNMLKPDDVVTGVDYDEELSVVVVRTKRKTNYEKKLKKKVQTSGCAQGTAFGDLMEALENVTLPDAKLRTSWLYTLPTRSTPRRRSISKPAPSTAACWRSRTGRWSIWKTSAAIMPSTRSPAGCSNTASARADKIFYTTGRLTSEMVIKTVRMGIPILISRSGFTAWGVELARKANLTLIGRARGKRFIALAGEDRIVFDQDLAYVEEESAKHRRKAAMHDEYFSHAPRSEHPVPRRLVNTGRPSAAMTRNLGLVLAGGLARRMGGGDKARIRDRQRNYSRTRARRASRHNAASIIINANGDAARFADARLPVVADSVPDFAGPLAGILAGLDWAAAHTPGYRMACERAGRLSVPAEGFGQPPARCAHRIERCARLRPIGRMAPSGRWPMAGDATRGFTPRARRRRHAQDRAVDRAAWRRDRRLAGNADRSVFQRQYAGGRGAGRSASRRNIRTRDGRYSRCAVGSQGNAARRLASKLSIASRYSSVTSISSMPRTRRSLRNGLMSKRCVPRSGAISD